MDQPWGARGSSGVQPYTQLDWCREQRMAVGMRSRFIYLFILFCRNILNIYFYFFYICIIILFYLFIFFYFIVLVLPYINMHPSRVYMCSPSWILLPPPSPYHPSGSSQCTSPKLPVSWIEPGLAIHFLYDIIHVLMPFSQIIPPLPLPQSPKDCSIHLCLFCCLAYRLVITTFLNSIYMR